MPQEGHLPSHHTGGGFCTLGEPAHLPAPAPAPTGLPAAYLQLWTVV